MAALISVSQPLQTIRCRTWRDAEGGRDIIQDFADHGAVFRKVAAGAGRASAIRINLMNFLMPGR
jgi:hypothetical protein